MTRRQLWSVATTLHDVHFPLRSATFVSSWTEFPHRPAVSMSFWDIQGVFTSLCPDNDQLLLQRLVPVLDVQVWWRPV